MHIATICVILQALVSTVNSQAQIWLTTGDAAKKLNREPDSWGSGSPVGGSTIDINRGAQFQDIKGFGAALSNAAASLLWYSPEREAVLQGLFSPTQGIGLSYVRLVMGGSDFNAVWPYTYNDAGYVDFPQDMFSIANDQQFVIPVIKEILRINPQVRIMGSPWTAPAWMKDTWNLYGGTIESAPEYLSSLTEYFVRFIRAYQAEGISIDALTLQNEPQHSDGGYPTMLMPWDVQRDLIAYHLGPRFQQEGITTQIVIWDHNWNDYWYPLNVLNAPEAKQYIGGTAWHCYGGDKNDPQNVNNAHPDKDMYFTECTGHDGDTNFGSVLGWNMQNLFIGQTRIGARTVLLWNLALDENDGPRVGVTGGCGNCRGVVTIPSGGGNHNKEVEYYILGHLSQFVKPGARRIDSTTYLNDLETVAFQNPDGSVAVVVVNLSWDTGREFQIQLDGQWYYYNNLPTRSVITFFL